MPARSRSPAARPTRTMLGHRHRAARGGGGGRACGRTRVDVLAELPALFLPPSGFVVTPVLGYWRSRTRSAWWTPPRWPACAGCRSPSCWSRPTGSPSGTRPASSGRASRWPGCSSGASPPACSTGCCGWPAGNGPGTGSDLRPVRRLSSGRCWPGPPARIAQVRSGTVLRDCVRGRLLAWPLLLAGRCVRRLPDPGGDQPGAAHRSQHRPGDAGVQEVTITTDQSYRFSPSTITVHPGKVRITLSTPAPARRTTGRCTGFPADYVPLVYAGADQVGGVHRAGAGQVHLRLHHPRRPGPDRHARSCCRTEADAMRPDLLDLIAGASPRSATRSAASATARWSARCPSPASSAAPRRAPSWPSRSAGCWPTGPRRCRSRSSACCSSRCSASWSRSGSAGRLRPG